MFNINFADCWIRTVDLRIQKRSIYHCTFLDEVLPLLSDNAMAPMMMFQGRTLTLILTSVIRWLDYVFNIWPFKTMKFARQYLKTANVDRQILQNIT